MKKSTKKLSLLVLSLLLMMLLAACGDDNSVGKDGENKDINSNNKTTTFTVGFDKDFPPHGYVDPKTGEFIGFDLDLARECAKRMNKDLVLRAINWDAKDMELESGAIDCIWNGFTMNGRENLYTWTDAYMDNSQVFVVRSDSGITAFADLSGKNVEAQKDSSAQKALENSKVEKIQNLFQSFGKFITVADYNTAMMDLESGAVDAVAMDIGVAKFQIEGRNDKFVILEENISEEQYGIGFKLGNTALRDQVQAAVMTMVEDGTFAEISNAWFGYDVCVLGK